MSVEVLEKRVLIVDPNSSTLAFLKEKLEASNLRVRTAISGRKGLNLLKDERFDLVLCALEMPKPHAIDMVMELQELGILTPIIFLSRFIHDQPDARKAIEILGPYEVMDKPIFMNKLYERIESRLQMKIAWRERRLSDRFPVRLDVVFTHPGRIDSSITIRARTVDLSLGGLQFERTMCEICTGYEKGGVHPDCVLARFSSVNKGIPVTLKVGLPEEEPLILRAHVAHTIIEEGTTKEFIGVKFSEISEGDKDRLRSAIRKIRDDHDRR